MKRHAFLLTEVLVLVVLASVIMLLSAQMMSSAMKSIGNSGRYMAESRALDGALVQLRRDVWSAAAVSQPDNSSLELTTTQGEKIIWTMTEEHQLVRTPGPTAGTAHLAFSGMPLQLTFTIEKTAVVVRTRDSVRRDCRIVLPSQLLLAGGQ